MLRNFRSDENYLAKYHERAGLILSVANVCLAFLNTPSLQSVLWYLPCLYLFSSPQVTFVLLGYAYALAIGMISGDFETVNLFGLVIGVLLTFPITGLLHCASHDSIRPKWLNRPVGEFMGLVQMFGFPDWKVLHFMHHSHTDDPELDPHPPLAKGYWDFAKGMRTAASTAFLKHFLKQFGDSPETMRAVNRYVLASQFDTAMKLVFWFLVLGPQAYTFIFLTSIAFKMLHYAWLNHATHRPGNQGAEVQNLNHGFYALLNALSFGLYYHKNHHAAPSLFNPKHLGAVRERLKKDLNNAA